MLRVYHQHIFSNELFPLPEPPPEPHAGCDRMTSLTGMSARAISSLEAMHLPSHSRYESHDANGIFEGVYGLMSRMGEPS
jgi:hypothetical protein